MSFPYPGEATYISCQEYPSQDVCHCNNNPFSDYCLSTLGDRCLNSTNNAIGTYQCTNWLSAYCTAENIRDVPACKAYATSVPAKGAIDATMADYCRRIAAPGDPLCTCINSPLPCPNKLDRNCRTYNGYETYDMVHSTCPDVLSCEQQVNLSPDAINLAVNIEQNCGGSGSSNEGVVERLNAYLAMFGIGGLNETTWIYVLIFILVSILLIAAAAFDDSSDKN